MASIVIGGLFILFSVFALASTSAVFAGRSGIINFAINGGMIMGATGYVLSAKALVSSVGELTWWIPFLSLIVAIIFAMLTTSLLSFAAINLRSDHMIVGMAVNIVAPIISLVLIIAVTGGKESIDINDIQMSLHFAKMIGVSEWEVQLVIAGIVGVIIISLIVLIKNSRLGMRIRAVGENPHALASAGVSVTKTKHIAMAFSGMLAGLAGGILVAALPMFGKFDSSVFGIGFIAISILLIGRWRVEWTVVASFGFALIYALIQVYAKNFGEHEKWWLHIVPYLSTLLLLPIFIRVKNTPKALGVQYKNIKR